MSMTVRLVVIYPWGDYREGDIIPEDDVEEVLKSRSHQVVRALVPEPAVKESV
jgi:hypothetical protein